MSNHSVALFLWNIFFRAEKKMLIKKIYKEVHTPPIATTLVWSSPSSSLKIQRRWWIICQLYSEKLMNRFHKFCSTNFCVVGVLWGNPFQFSVPSLFGFGLSTAKSKKQREKTTTTTKKVVHHCWSDEIFNDLLTSMWWWLWFSQSHCRPFVCRIRTIDLSLSLLLLL